MIKCNKRIQAMISKLETDDENIRHFGVPHRIWGNRKC